MKLLVFPDFVSVVNEDGVNIASFFGSLRYVEAGLLMKRLAQ
jgi:hypothetical protein